MTYRANVCAGAALIVLRLAGAVGAAADDEPLWNAAWLTDTQTPACEWIDALAAAVQANRPAIVLHTGDTRFEWANRCAWDAVMRMFRSENPPRELHLAPGNHDLVDGVLKGHLRRPALRTVQATWGSAVPAGASQICFRFMDSEAVTYTKLGAADAPAPIVLAEFPFASPVMYERAARRHWITIEDVTVPETAVEIQVIALSRVCIEGTCTTLCSPVACRKAP